MRNSYYEQYKNSTINQLNLSLNTACRNADLELVKFLLRSSELEKHADIFSVELTGFQWACYVGHIDVVKYLTSSIELDKHIELSSDNYGGLTSACLGGHLDIVQYFFKNIGDSTPNIDDIYSDSIIQAAINKHYHVISFIIVDKNAPKTDKINNFLLETPNENIDKIFALRDLNKKLNNELNKVKNKQNIKKIKI